jgi:hypothetical protein
MGKHPQNRFRRLVVVGSTNKEQRRQAAEPHWWGPPRAGGLDPKQATQTTQVTRAQFKALRMAVMPTFSRGLWLEAMAWIVNLVRGYFVARPKRRRGAVVLSFRRQGFRRPWAEETFVSKKASGSVCWTSDRDVAPQEGGRG